MESANEELVANANAGRRRQDCRTNNVSVMTYLSQEKESQFDNGVTSDEVEEKEIVISSTPVEDVHKKRRRRPRKSASVHTAASAASIVKEVYNSKGNAQKNENVIDETGSKGMGSDVIDAVYVETTGDSARLLSRSNRVVKEMNGDAAKNVNKTHYLGGEPVKERNIGFTDISEETKEREKEQTGNSEQKKTEIYEAAEKESDEKEYDDKNMSCDIDVTTDITNNTKNVILIEESESIMEKVKRLKEDVKSLGESTRKAFAMIKDLVNSLISEEFKNRLGKMDKVKYSLISTLRGLDSLVPVLREIQKTLYCFLEKTKTAQTIAENVAKIISQLKKTVDMVYNSVQGIQSVLQQWSQVLSTLTVTDE